MISFEEAALAWAKLLMRAEQAEKRVAELELAIKAFHNPAKDVGADDDEGKQEQ